MLEAGRCSSSWPYASADSHTTQKAHSAPSARRANVRMTAGSRGKKARGSLGSRGWRQQLHQNVGYTAIPPPGKFAPPPAALVLVNGRMTTPDPAATECALLPESTAATNAWVVPSTTPSFGVRLQT